MDYQLLVLDVDGTATNSAKQVTEKTRDAVVRLQERGVRVVIASGRAPNGVYPVAEALKLHRFGSHILAFNGAKIIRLRESLRLRKKAPYLYSRGAVEGFPEIPPGLSDLQGRYSHRRDEA